jgi:hypothetical protein
MKAPALWWIVVAAIISLGAGIALSHMIERGVRVEKLMLTTNVPALRVFPATPGPHPVALLAHGATGSKENMLRIGEALAAAGFECYSVDQAGHGESPLACSITNIGISFREVVGVLGPVDVFVGHSMGGGVGAWGVREAVFRPKLLIGIGANAEVGEGGPPVLLLAGLFEEFVRPARLQARTNAQAVISPWCDHIFEVWDPVLVGAAANAACVAVGKPVPAAPTAWLWRFGGAVLGFVGALVLAFYLPELHLRLARVRRFIVPVVLLIAVVLTLGSWCGVTPQLRRVPQQLVLLGVIWLVLAGLCKWRMPRWSLAVGTGILALGCLALRVANANHLFLISVLMCILGISTLLLVVGVAVGRIASRGGSRRDGDMAMAIFSSYVIGQFMPMFY